MEEELKRSEKRYALAQQAANIGSWERNLADDTIYWTEQIEPIFGLDRGQFAGTREAFLKYVHPDDRPKLIEASRALVEEGKHFTVEHRIIRPDGSIRWVIEIGDVVRGTDDEAICMIGIIQDITERKRTEESLRESEERFKSAFEYTAIGMALTDINGRFLRVNRAWCEMIGYSEQELLNMTFQAITYPNDIELNQDYLHQLLAGEIDSFHIEKRYFHKCGHVIWVQLSVALMYDAHGKPLHLISQIQNITDRKQAETALRQAKEAAEAADRAKSEFLANMSH